MKLELTRKTDLAYQALTLIAANPDTRVNGAQLSVELDVSPQYLPHVMSPLTRAGWIHSTSGPHGGYAVATNLEDLTLLNLIEAVEGPVDESRCLHLGPMHEAGANCALHAPWTRARSALLDELAATRLSDMIPVPH